MGALPFAFWKPSVGGVATTRWVTTPTASPSLRTDFAGGAVGAHFNLSTGVPLTVKSLGRYCYGIITSNHKLSFWQLGGGGVLLAEVTVPIGTPVGWAEIPITPVVATDDGNGFFLAIEVVGSTDQWCNSQPVTTTGIETAYRSCYKSPPYGIPTNTHDAGTMYVPVTFYY